MRKTAILLALACAFARADYGPGTTDSDNLRSGTPVVTNAWLAVSNETARLVASSAVDPSMITDGTNAIDAARNVYTKRGTGSEWRLVSGNPIFGSPVWQSETGYYWPQPGWYANTGENGWAGLSSDYYATTLRGVLEGRFLDVGYVKSTNVWERSATEFHQSGKLALVSQLPTAPDFTTNNAQLVATIEATAPAPGNYLAVSNAAMSARGKSDLSLYNVTNTFSAWEYYDVAPGITSLSQAEWTESIGAWSVSFLFNGVSSLATIYESSPDALTIAYDNPPYTFSARRERVGILVAGGGLATTNSAGGMVILGSFAQGTNTTASGAYSHAEGDRTTASGKAAHAEGVSTHAQGDGSHASGVNTYASQRATFATGVSVSGTNSASFVWSGIEASPRYGTHGKGTFSVNPIGGLNGFYVGEKTIQQAIVSSLEDDSVSNSVPVVLDGETETTNTVQVKTVRQAVLDAVSDEIAIPTRASDVGAYPATDGYSLASTVNAWESYWGGTNVIFEVTNYYGNTSGELPRLRIKEFKNGAWTNVWDEANKFDVCERKILGHVADSNAALLAECRTNFSPMAWGSVTDKGFPNVVSNTVYMSAPETYFGGGTDYQRVAVGSGAICVLVDRGALVKTTGEPGTFRFQDNGGTNFFGFAKSDSYTIGCRTDGIEVDDATGLVTLRYDVIMANSDVPIVYYKQALEEATWTQLNNSDGTAADGAPYTVTWYTSGGSYYAAINCGSNPSGFFQAETSVMGDVVFETNMKMRLDGGLACTNTANGTVGVIRPTYNGSSVTWNWSAK